ncbi:MAG: thymidine kinase, partial [Erysipelotrichaceae bacterium]|nr:thymidine kinase [Erysipelotrichaceae bacterium]
FKFGTMNSSKTANCLMTKFNYEEKGKKVWLIKPAIDNRDGERIVKSRIGLQAEADVVSTTDDLLQLCPLNDVDVVICDEAQFLTGAQVDQLRLIVSDYDIPVLCFGLRTDFTTHLFEGSRRLMELADSITVIKSICKCGAKSTVNARIDSQGHVVTSGAQIVIGGNEAYESMCWSCWHKMVMENRNNNN